MIEILFNQTTIFLVDYKHFQKISSYNPFINSVTASIPCPHAFSNIPKQGKNDWFLFKH